MTLSQFQDITSCTAFLDFIFLLANFFVVNASWTNFLTGASTWHLNPSLDEI